MDYTLPRMGLMAGERLEQLVSLLTRRRRIEELPLPLGIIATDLTEGKRVILRSGSIAKAVRASCAIPGIFKPVEIDGRLMVDGGVLEMVPARAVKEMGAGLVIAVDVGSYEDEHKIENMFDIIFRAIKYYGREITIRESGADLVISPDLGESLLISSGGRRL